MVPKSGIILLDKPAGLTSGQAVQKITQALGLQKAGHTGTLDKMATGLLIIAAGEARKAIPAFAGLSKTYTGTIYLHGEAERKEISNAFKKFTGQIIQLPPRKSAVARKPRKRIVYSFEPKGVEGRVVGFEVMCEAGVYIRKLAHDIGKALGCGAHLGELRRTAIGNLTVNKASKIQKPELYPLEDILNKISLPKITINPDSVRRVRHGAPVRSQDIIEADSLIKKGDLVGIFSGGHIIALGRAKADYKDVKSAGKRIVAQTDRVFG